MDGKDRLRKYLTFASAAIIAGSVGTSAASMLMSEHSNLTTLASEADQLTQLEHAAIGVALKSTSTGDDNLQVAKTWGRQGIVPPSDKAEQDLQVAKTWGRQGIVPPSDKAEQDLQVAKTWGRQGIVPPSDKAEQDLQVAKTWGRQGIVPPSDEDADQEA